MKQLWKKVLFPFPSPADFPLLSMNQYRKRILQRCVVFMAYVDLVNDINTTYILKI